ncbi:PREDICTED: uncharacterized protein LOC104817829 isoform X2 [Tarenaya hassleriana]|uniref:uncharacterized protein LOC104817829 isoform X2 n=1 Tax=Tarenaya hassleriana TaxID=28532 RepID=UPI00053C8751|nr:PREDICTED: uncharacterized protein LOC104817829 isoform X2 [Tarenaya hassleriana]
MMVVVVDAGERPMMPDNAAEQPLSPKDERIISTYPPTDAANVGSSSDSGIPNPAAAYLIPTHFPYEWNVMPTGYGPSVNSWDGYPQYATPEALHVPPVVYNENPSLMYHPSFSFNPFPPMMLEGQLLATQQIPISPAYFQHLGVSSAIPLTPSESGGDSALLDPVSGYVFSFGQYGGGRLSGNLGINSLASPLPYPQTMGILGPYEQNAAQLPLHGCGVAPSSSLGGYPHTESYQSPNLAASCYGADNPVRFTLDKGKRRENDQSSVSTTSDPYGNRGPRASMVKNKNSFKPSSTVGDSKNYSTTDVTNPSLYSHPDFVTEYKNAKFFIIKSFSEDNVHRSIKYSTWASTPHGSKKLDTAYGEAKQIGGECPVFLFFSVNASGQFCGVSEMVGPVDFDKDAAYWQQDRWSGQFPVKWHIVKDVPNNRFCHILLRNNDNKPVTHSRDSQEVKLEQGIEMLRIFKEYEVQTSILDDFGYYDEREKSAEERKKVGENSRRSQRGDQEASTELISERVCQVLTLRDGDAADDKGRGRE